MKLRYDGREVEGNELSKIGKQFDVVREQRRNSNQRHFPTPTEGVNGVWRFYEKTLLDLSFCL